MDKPINEDGTDPAIAKQTGQGRGSQAFKDIAAIGGLAGLYLAFIAASMLFARGPDSVSVFWPGNGFLLAVLLRCPPPWRRAVLGMSALALFSANLFHGKTVLPSLGFTLANIAEVAAAFRLVKGLPGGSAFLGNLPGTIRFFTIVCLGSAGVSAAIGGVTASLFYGGGIARQCGNWLVTHAAGLAVTTPVMLAWLHGGFRWERRKWSSAEFAAGTAAALFMAYVTFARPAVLWSALGRPMPYIAFPFLVWAALRFGARGATTVQLGVYVITAWFTSRGQGPFALGGEPGSGMLVSMQVFPYAAAFCSLVPAALIQSQRRTEAALRSRESRYGCLWNSKLIGIYVTDLQGKVQEANETFLAMMGYTREDLAQGEIDMYSMTTPEGLGQAQANAARFRLDGQIGPFERDWTLRDGRVFSSLAYASLMEEPDRALCMVMDIGPLKHARRELRLRDSRYRDLLSSTLIGIFVTDLRGQVTEANDTFLAMIRHTRPELEAGLIYTAAMATPEYADGAEARRGQFQRTGRMGPFDREWQLRDGARLNTLFFATKMEGNGNALCMVLDTNELKRTKAELRVVESRFKNMFDSNIVGMAVMNKSRVFEEANDAYLDLTGYTRQELEAGKVTAESLHVPELKRQYAEVEVSVRNTGKMDPQETRYRRKDGSTVPVYRGVAHVDESERYLIVAIDLTHEKATQSALAAAEKEAVAANHAKSEFLAHMSHEIRTPLNGVLGMMSLLSDTELSAEQQTYARAGRESGDHLLSLINQVLDFSKLESGRMDLDSSEFSLDAVVEGAFTSVLEMAQKKGMEIAVKPDPAIPARVIGDPVRLQQVLMNLLGNAVKFSDRGTIRIGSSLLAKSGGACEVLFEVADRGPGISPAAMENLFRPFRQGDATLARKAGGTGLGLAISKELVERMGGRIWVESKPREETCFRFTVRLGESGTSGGWENDADRDGEKQLALMVEPHGESLSQAQAILTRFGFATRALADGQELLRHLDAPGESGVALAILALPQEAAESEATLRILSRARIAGVPVLCTLPFFAQARWAGLVRAGAAGILAKPWRGSDVYNAIRCALPDWHGVGLAVPEKAGAGSISPDWAFPPRILVVDDHPVNLTVASAMLKRMGCDVETVQEGSAALFAALARPYDLVFMDCQMPVMDGYETTRRLRAQESGRRRTRIVALTAHAVNGARERCLAEGMDDYISKPFTLEQIAKILRKWIKTEADALPFPGSPSSSDMPSDGNGGAAQSMVDWARLENLTDGTSRGSEMVRSLIRLFVDTTRTSLESLRADLDASRWRQVGKALHKMKGGCGTIGARGMFGQLEAMEGEAGSGRTENLAAMFPHLEDVFEETCGLLETPR